VVNGSLSATNSITCNNNQTINFPTDNSLFHTTSGNITFDTNLYLNLSSTNALIHAGNTVLIQNFTNNSGSCFLNSPGKVTGDNSVVFNNNTATSVYGSVILGDTITGNNNISITNNACTTGSAVWIAATVTTALTAASECINISNNTSYQTSACINIPNGGIVQTSTTSGASITFQNNIANDIGQFGIYCGGTITTDTLNLQDNCTGGNFGFALDGITSVNNATTTNQIGGCSNIV